MTNQDDLETLLPLVGEDQGNRGLWLGLGGIMLSGAALFVAIESSRHSGNKPPAAPATDFGFASTARPELTIPETPQATPVYYPRVNRRPPETPSYAQPPKAPPVRLTSSRPSVENRIPPPPPPRPNPITYQPSYPGPVVSPIRQQDPGRGAPVIVYDVAAGFTPTVQSGEQSIQSTRSAPSFAKSATDRSALVPQGTLIFAALETALDSTQSGQTRAIISSPVYNASGTKILIPKGSRIFGEYRANLNPGQKRAQVIWGRLIRPDGVSIILDSPASDQLGRAGIKGRVDTHFEERLLSALLQSTLDFGANVASRAVSPDNGVIIALPNGTRSVGSQILQPPPRPTLKVKHGTQISVFVARDLDFSAVE
jgi:type IV secretion system protein VirB10